jgi:hypothetical protein
MERSVRSVVVLVVVLASLLPVAAGHARDAAAVAAARSWGLIGVWSLDCDRPASDQNGRFGYRVRGDGMLEHYRDVGKGLETFDLLSARIVADSGHLELVLDMPSFKQQRRYAVAKDSEWRMRAMSNANVETGKYSIRDGTFVANGKATPWLLRCSDLHLN